MPETVQQRLRKTLNNIRQQKEDLRFESPNNRIRFYFDAYDVLDAIMGFSRFFNGNAFKTSVFESKSTLVQSLATSGNLGGVHLLIPHKAELFTQLKILKNKFEPQIYKKARDFTIKTGFNSEEFDWLEANSDEDMKQRLIQSIDADTAETFFRTVHSLAPWHKRLKDVVTKNRIVINTEAVDNNTDSLFSNIFRSDYFQKLKSIFNLLRPRADRSKNNLTDAICIAVLIEKVRLVSSDNGDRIKYHPRFLATANSLLSVFLETDSEILREIVEKLVEQNNSNPKHVPRIVEQTLQIQEMLSYRQNDLIVNVMQDENYFIYKAILKPYELASRENEKFDTLSRRLTEWETQTGTFLAASGHLATQKDFVQLLNSWETTIEKRVKEFFFREVWLNPLDRTNSQAFQDLGKAIADTVEAYEEFKFEQITELNKRNDRLINETELKVKTEINDAEIILSLLDKLDKKISSNRGTSDLRRVFKDSDNLRREFWNYFPIYRYSFDRSAHDETVQLIKQLLISTRPAKLTLESNFVELLELGRKNLKSEDSERVGITRKLEEVTATLYALQLKEELWYLLTSYGKQLPRFSFLIILGELYLDKNVDLKGYARNKPAREIISSLQEMYNSREKGFEQEDQCRLAIGLSLLNFWRWRKDGGESLWTDAIENEKDIAKQKKKENSIELGIWYAKEAYQQSSTIESLKAENLYALNLSVFFLAVSNNVSKEHFEELIRLGEELERLSVKDEYTDIWQFRYNDTLARYYCKRVVRRESLEERKRLLNKAITFCDLAYDKAPNDQTVQKTKKIIGNIENEIYKAPSF